MTVTQVRQVINLPHHLVVDQKGHDGIKDLLTAYFQKADDLDFAIVLEKLGVKYDWDYRSNTLTVTALPEEKNNHDYVCPNPLAS